MAGALERASEHPLAGAVLRAAVATGITLESPTVFFSEPGMGGGVVGGHAVLAIAAFLYNSPWGSPSRPACSIP